MGDKSVTPPAPDPHALEPPLRSESSVEPIPPYGVPPMFDAGSSDDAVPDTGARTPPVSDSEADGLPQDAGGDVGSTEEGGPEQ